MSNKNAATRVHEIIEAVNQVVAEEGRAVVASVVHPGTSGLLVGAKLLVRDRLGTVGTLGNMDLDQAVSRHAETFLQTRDEAKALRVSEFAAALTPFADAKILFERIEAEPRLIIAGAGHVGASLARFAALAGYHVTLIDDRAEFVDRTLFANKSETAIDLVAATNWQQAMRDAIGNGKGASVAIVTRGHKQDEECLRAALASRPDYLGMIGSKRRTNIVLEKLREAGADENELGKVRAPIGLDLGAVSPEEVALSILSEIVAERRGGTGASLSRWRRG